MTDTTTRDSDTVDRHTYTDQHGQPLHIRAWRGPQTGVTIENPQDDSTSWTFNTTEAREIATSLNLAADAVDKALDPGTENAGKTMSPLDFTTITPSPELLCHICHSKPATLAVGFTSRINGDWTDLDVYACTSCAEHHAYAFTTDLTVFEAALARYRDTADTQWVDERTDGLEVARHAYARMRESCGPLLVALEFSPAEIEAGKASMTRFVIGTEMTTVRTG